MSLYSIQIGSTIRFCSVEKKLTCIAVYNFGMLALQTTHRDLCIVSFCMITGTYFGLSMVYCEASIRTFCFEFTSIYIEVYDYRNQQLC